MENYWREGPHALSVNEVCRRMGLSKPSLYREFGGEDGLLDAALEHYWKTVLAPLAAYFTPNHSFAETTEVLIAFATDPGERPKGCLLAKSRGVRERFGPVAGARVDTMSRTLKEAYLAMINRARDRGEVRGDITPELAARYVDTQVTTALHQVAAGQDPDEVRAQTELAFAALLST